MTTTEKAVCLLLVLASLSASSNAAPEHEDACGVLKNLPAGDNGDSIAKASDDNCDLHTSNNVYVYGTTIKVEAICKVSSPVTPRYVVFETLRPSDVSHQFQRQPWGWFSAANKTNPAMGCRGRYAQRVDRGKHNGLLAAVFWHAPRSGHANASSDEAVDLRATIYDARLQPTVILAKTVNFDKKLHRVPRGYYDNFRPIAVDSCGVTKNCFRYGKEKCTSDTCIYLLTYRKEGEDVFFEIDAKTTGWAAVGFSSDRFMGGDDVYACVNTDEAKNTVAVKRYQNVINWSIEQSFNPVNDTEGRIKDGRISCRFSRKKRIPHDETVTDLDNTWHFLYAWGPATSGTIRIHSLTSPPRSKIKLPINTVNLRNDFSAADCPSCDVSAVVLATLLATLSQYFIAVRVD